MFKKISLLFLIILPAIAPLSSLAAEPLSSTLKGRILLAVESKGEAWYVDPITSKRAYLGRPADAFALMRSYGLGISNADLAKIAAPGKKDVNLALAKRLAGRILLAVESKGEAYYINPTDLKKYYLGRPADAFAVMRDKGLGITNANLEKIPATTSANNKPVDITPIEEVKPEIPATTTPEIEIPATEETVATTTKETISIENFTWRGSVKIASNRHTPQIYYSSNGDLWLFYVDGYDNLYARVRRSNDLSFNRETIVANKARKARPWFNAQGQLEKLAISGSEQVSILKTTDGGESWQTIKSYPNQDQACSPAYPEAKLIGAKGEILVFGYELNSGIFGCYTKIKSAAMENETWSDTTKTIGDGDVVSASINGSVLTIAGSASIFRSSDKGESYAEIKGGDTTQDRFGSQSAISIDGEYFLGRSYSYGPENQANKHLGIVLGAKDFSAPERIIIQSSDSYYRGFEISGSNNVIVATWTIYGSAGRLKGSISADHGKTWSSAFDVARTPTGYDIPFPDTGENIGFKATSFLGQTAIAYTAQKGISNDIYLVEYK
jgi:hypothetical protein